MTTTPVRYSLPRSVTHCPCGRRRPGALVQAILRGEQAAPQDCPGCRHADVTAAEAQAKRERCAQYKAQASQPGRVRRFVAGQEVGR